MWGCSWGVRGRLWVVVGGHGLGCQMPGCRLRPIARLPFCDPGCQTRLGPNGTYTVLHMGPHSPGHTRMLGTWSGGLRRCARGRGGDHHLHLAPRVRVRIPHKAPALPCPFLFLPPASPPQSKPPSSPPALRAMPSQCSQLLSCCAFIFPLLGMTSPPPTHPQLPPAPRAVV